MDAASRMGAIVPGLQEAQSDGDGQRPQRGDGRLAEAARAELGGVPCSPLFERRCDPQAAPAVHRPEERVEREGSRRTDAARERRGGGGEAERGDARDERDA